ncbi:hypothetical protein ACE1N8_31860 [Streptomyces sp. DSM 116494]|uniref:hypothetical protein n=1 Tax=Streptomyces okerensis TaxID=3344655 RepID=UPI003890160C
MGRRRDRRVAQRLLDDIQVLDPRRTELVPDDSPNHRKARLYLEAVIRKTALPQTEHGLALADGFLMDKQTHQLRPAELALSMKNPQPRVLIADVVGLGKTQEREARVRRWSRKIEGGTCENRICGHPPRGAGGGAT